MLPGWLKLTTTRSFTNERKKKKAGKISERLLASSAAKRSHVQAVYILYIYVYTKNSFSLYTTAPRYRTPRGSRPTPHPLRGGSYIAAAVGAITPKRHAYCAHEKGFADDDDDDAFAKKAS